MLMKPLELICILAIVPVGRTTCKIFTLLSTFVPRMNERGFSLTSSDIQTGREGVDTTESE